MPRPLIVSATRAEAAFLPEGLEVVVTGIGKTACATVLARHLARRDDLDDLVLVNLGSAGALRDEPRGTTAQPGLYEIGTVFNHDINAEAINALGFDARERFAVGDAATVLATGDVFVNDPAVRDRLAVTADLVDMEGYAVAFVGAEFGLPVRLVKHVSDNADEGAMDWVALVERSARVLGAWAAEHLA